MSRLAIFDLDHTLLAGDSDHLWGAFLVERGLVDGEVYARENDRFYAEYQAGTLDIHAYAAFAFEPLVRLGHQRLEPCAANSWGSRFSRSLRPAPRPCLIVIAPRATPW